jgi:protein TonB
VYGGRGLTKEAIRVLKAMPAWTPGRMNGKPVRVKMNVPVKFKLE